MRRSLSREQMDWPKQREARSSRCDTRTDTPALLTDKDRQQLALPHDAHGHARHTHVHTRANTRAHKRTRTNTHPDMRAYTDTRRHRRRYHTLTSTPIPTPSHRDSETETETERQRDIAREDTAYSRTPSRTCDGSDCRESLSALTSVENRLNVARTRRLVGVTGRETAERIARHDDCRDSQERAACYLHHFTRAVRRWCRPLSLLPALSGGPTSPILARAPTHTRTRIPTQAPNAMNNGGQFHSGRGARSSSL